MLYLVTGANGAGKTLLTLKHVKELADKAGRPVCYNGRFDVVVDGPLANWKKIDIKDWQAEPDGTIFFVDECHNDFPTRPSGSVVPEYVRMLAEHRKRGFDFFLITQHPLNIDAFVRRLIGNPGWHRHLKRVAGASLVSQLQWDAVAVQCERAGSGESGQVQMVPFPKEVYTWYNSAQLHTGKLKIPRAAWILLLAVILVPALGWFGLHRVRQNVLAQASPAHATPVASSSGAPGAPGAPGQAAPTAKPMTAAEYVVDRLPRLAGLAYTAPAYDGVTKPTIAPIPAACVLHQVSGKCDCYSQQATRLQVPVPVCVEIARNGVFIDWQQAGPAPGGGVRGSAPASPGPLAVLPGVVAAAPHAAGAASSAGSAPVVVSYGGEVPLGAVDDHALDLARLAQARREWEARPVASPILLLGQRP